MLHGFGTHFIADWPRDSSDILPGYGLFGLDGKVLHNSKQVRLERVDKQNPQRLTLTPDGASRLFTSGDDKNGRGQAVIAPKYDRIVDNYRPPHATNEDQLVTLAEKLREAPQPSAESGISAAYTYFGQLIAHDLCRSTYIEGKANVFNESSPPLNFDTLFKGNIPFSPEGMTLCGGGLCLGTTQTGRFQDLPRARTSRAAIVDDRNDHNLMLAQMVVAVTRFHHCVGKLCRPANDSEHRRITQRHLQSIALDDFAHKLVPQTVIADVLANGRASVAQGSLPEAFQVSVEFALAVFRFGHAMVRETYKLNEGLAGATVRRLVNHTGLGGSLALKREWRLPDLWRVDWEVVMSPDGGPEQATGPLDVFLNVEMKELSPHLSEALSGDEPFNLAELTLVRGHTARLPSGQALVDKVNGLLTAHGKKPPDLIPKLPETDIAAVTDPDVASYLLATCDGPALAAQTPLWIYILREAALFRAQAKSEQPGFEGLGPLGARIVYETLHAAVQAAEGSIVGDDGSFRFRADNRLKPDGAPDKFTLADMFAVVRRCK